MSSGHEDEIDLGELEAHNNAISEAEESVGDAATVSVTTGGPRTSETPPTPNHIGGGVAAAVSRSIAELGRGPAEPQMASRNVTFSTWSETNLGFGCLLAIFLFSASFPILFAERRRAIDLFAFVCFAPSGAVFWLAHRKWRRVASTRAFFGEYAIGFVGLTTLVFFASIVLILISMAISILLMSLTGFRRFDLLVEVIIALSFSVVEEVTKYVLATRRYSSEGLKNPKQYVLMPLMAALGLSTGESFNMALFVRTLVDFSVSSTSSSHHRHRPSGNETAAPIATTADASSEAAADQGEAMSAALFVLVIIACCLVFMPSNILSGYFIGLGVAKRRVLGQPVTTPNILLLPVIFRFLFFYVLFFLSSRTHGVALIALPPLLFGFLVLVKRFEQSMPQDYLNKTGFLNALGYGVIGSGDADDDDDGGALEPHGVPAAEVVRANDFRGEVPRSANDSEVSNVSISKLSL